MLLLHPAPDLLGGTLGTAPRTPPATGGSGITQLA